MLIMPPDAASRPLSFPGMVEFLTMHIKYTHTKLAEKRMGSRNTREQKVFCHIVIMVRKKETQSHISNKRRKEMVFLAQENVFYYTNLAWQFHIAHILFLRPGQLGLT